MDTILPWILSFMGLGGVLGAALYIGKLMGQGDRAAERFEADNERLREEVGRAKTAKDMRSGADLPDKLLHYRD